MAKKNYEEEALKLSKAIDIAVEAFEKFPPEMWSEEVTANAISSYKEWKDSALNPAPEYRKIASLNYIINDVFTFFQEGRGKEVEYFWKQLKEQNLEYIRENKLSKIIKRGTIKTRIEFEYVTEAIIVAEQEKTITEYEVKKLAEMIDEFESRNN